MLQHHPFSWLHDEESRGIRRITAQKGDLLLSGHIHQNDAEQLNNIYGSFLKFQAGTIYDDTDKTTIFRALLGSFNCDTKKIIISAIRYSGDLNRWVPDPEFPTTSFDIKRDITLEKDEDNLLLYNNKSENKLKRKNSEAKIPIVVFAMNEKEAEELETENIFKNDLASPNDSSNYQKLLIELGHLGIKDWKLNYKCSRDEWIPYSRSIPINNIISNIVSEFNQRREKEGKSQVWADLVSDKFIDEDSEIWEKLNECGGIVILDPISLFHPILKQKLINSGVINQKKVGILLLSSMNHLEHPINKILRDMTYNEMRNIVSNYEKKYNSLCEIGIGDNHTFQRRLFSILFDEAEITKDCYQENNRAILPQIMGRSPRGLQEFI
jgi:hypothetical protein